MQVEDTRSTNCQFLQQLRIGLPCFSSSALGFSCSLLAWFGLWPKERKQTQFAVRSCKLWHFTEVFFILKKKQFNVLKCRKSQIQKIQKFRNSKNQYFRKLEIQKMTTSKNTEIQKIRTSKHLENQKISKTISKSENYINPENHNFKKIRISDLHLKVLQN